MESETIKYLKDDLEKKLKDFFHSVESEYSGIEGDQSIFESIKHVFFLSDFVARTCIRRPAILIDLIKTNDLKRKYDSASYLAYLKNIISDVQDEDMLMRRLILFKAREMVRIAWRDLLNWADLSETLLDISRLADSIIDQTLDFLYEKLCLTDGTPVDDSGIQQRLVVLGMGKLGASELNFSSDIDLVFAYPEKGRTIGGQKTISNEEFFLKLCRSLIKTIGTFTSEGNLFRVDMRLRPYGENGPIAMSFDNMIEYYQLQGREWERYAWVRARAVAGDKIAGEELLKQLRPFIYRRYFDYTVFDSLREMKQKISIEAKQQDKDLNVKLGQGGIRELEFFCQAFQILRGGIVPVLQDGNTKKILKILAIEKYISENDSKELQKAYEFLRKTENHLQEFSDFKTHSIPIYNPSRHILAVSMGFNNFDEFMPVLNQMMKKVHFHFSRLLEKDEPGKKDKIDSDLSALWHYLDKKEDSEKLLKDAGFKEPEKVINLLRYFKSAPETRALSEKGRNRIDRLMPLLLKEASCADTPEPVLNRIIDLIKAIEQRASYIALMLENPSILSHLIKLADASDWIIDYLARHPVLLDELIDSRSLYATPDREFLESELKNKQAMLSGDDMEDQIEQLCVFKQANVLRIAAADVTGILPVMKVSDHLSYVAEVILKAVFDLSWDFLTDKHGMPEYEPGDKACGRGFLIVALGKLGGIELGYNSDIDLVFIHSAKQGKTSGVNNPIENSYFYTRIGQRIVHMLTSHTRAGILYETDMRLRPSGNAGPLVSHIEAFFEYQIKEGWTWEHQALVRARPIIGDPELAKRFVHGRRNVLGIFREEKKLKAEIREMRSRVLSNRLNINNELFDLKEDVGGIIDIEFLVQYLVLLKSHQYEELLEWTDNIRTIETLSELGIIDFAAKEILTNAYLTFRTQIHKMRLQRKPPMVDTGRFENLRSDVIKIWNNFLN